MQVYEWSILLVSVIVAAIAAIAAIAAWRAAKASEKANWAQIAIQITNTYSSPEMFESIKRLYDFKRKWEPDFGLIFEQLLQDQNQDPKYTTQIDSGRRRVSHYFHQIRALLDCGVVNEDFVLKLIKNDQIDTLLDVVEPLEAAKNSEYDRSIFKLFRDMYRRGV